MDAWIPITIAAAFAQNVRSALQKHLKGKLSTGGATYVRFLYAWPLALLYLWGLRALGGMPLPAPNTAFLAYVVAGSITQMLFTALLVWLFSFRNFAVGTTFSKTETIQIAVLGYVFLGDTVGVGALAAIVVSVAGVMAMSAGQTGVSLFGLARGLTERSTLVGLASGLCLGMSSVFYRGASLSLGYDGVVMPAAYTMTASLTVQSLLMGAYLLLREPGQMRAVLRAWRWSAAVGVAGVLASIGWMTAVTMQNAAYVRALGQIELVFTFAASTLLFREKSTRLEVVGIVLVTLGIVILLLFR
jgi:drug/metabolite transporter (DMT)-like permease